MKYKPPMMKERTCPAAEALVRELLLRKCPGVSSADNFAATHSYVMLWCLQTLDSSADAGAEELQQQAERKKGDAAIPGLQQAAVTQSLSANDRCHTHLTSLFKLMHRASTLPVCPADGIQRGAEGKQRQQAATGEASRLLLWPGEDLMHLDLRCVLISLLTP